MSQTEPITPTAALQRLLEGNRRFASGSPRDPVVSAERRAELTTGQSPFATVLGCVDSRAPIELIFDQSVGDLLTVRSAGEALSGSTTGNVEFGVRALGTELVAVVAHTTCGAVAAALDADRPDGPLGELVAEVAERLQRARSAGFDMETQYTDAIKADLEEAVKELRALDTLRLPDGSKPVVVGLLYHLDSGEVTVEDDGGLELG